MIKKEMMLELRQKAKNLEPIVRIGKNGLTDGVVEQIRKAVLKRKLIKVKLLQAFAEEHKADDVAQELATKTGAEIVSVVGFNISLYLNMPAERKGPTRT